MYVCLYQQTSRATFLISLHLNKLKHTDTWSSRGEINWTESESLKSGERVQDLIKLGCFLKLATIVTIVTRQKRCTSSCARQEASVIKPHNCITAATYSSFVCHTWFLVLTTNQICMSKPNDSSELVRLTENSSFKNLSEALIRDMPLKWIHFHPISAVLSAVVTDCSKCLTPCFSVFLHDCQNLVTFPQCYTLLTSCAASSYLLTACCPTIYSPVSVLKLYCPCSQEMASSYRWSLQF